MFEQAMYIQNSFSISFPRYNEIRRRANDFEDLLKQQFEGHYGQPQVIPVPDDLDPEVPRLIFGSRHGFSQIIVSQIGMTLNVTYSPDYQVNIEEGRRYLKERVPALYSMLSILGNVPVHFCGITTRTRIPVMKQDESRLFEHFRNCLPNVPSLENVHDVITKVTTIIDDTYYSNLAVLNYRSWKLDSTGQMPLRPSRNLAHETGLEISGDFNDRFAFNERPDYFSSADNAEAVVDKGLEQVALKILEIQG